MLGGIADTVAQTLTAVKRASTQKVLPKIEDHSIEIHELDKKNPFSSEETMLDYRRVPTHFDFERFTRFMGFAFIMAPVQHMWFIFLSDTFPVSKRAGTLAALKRVALDQFIFAPVGECGDELTNCCLFAKLAIQGLAWFFTFMTVAEGGGKRAVMRKFQDVYVPALKANYMVWPLVQMLNFRVIPIQFQIVSTEDMSAIDKLEYLTLPVALCLHDWYCLDGVSFHDEL